MSQAGINSVGSVMPSVVETLAGNDGIHVPPTGNNINVVGFNPALVNITGNVGTSTLTVTVNTNIAFAYTAINHASSPYTVLLTDYYISCDPTAGTIIINLPNAPVQFREFIIKDRTGQASTNNISITTVGGAVTIDGVTTYALTANFESVQLLFNGTSYEVF
jgi:hypothetical protein